jgi:hypothetical protein
MPYVKRTDPQYIVDQETGCWVWNWSVDKRGYGRAWDRDARRPRPAHRLIWMRERGPIPEGAYLCHHCDNRKCVNPDHLYIGDATSNVRDMMSRGRRKSTAGENNWRAQLTWGQVREIRERYTGKWGECAALAREYGVSRDTVYAIVTNKTWVEAS